MMSDSPPPDVPPDYPDEPPRAPIQELIFKPAKREKVGLIIGLSGPSWSGKTFSALRLAYGMAGPNGRVAVLDTERGRALTYADDFQPVFDHGELGEPFTPRRYADAAALSKKAGHDVLIIDSMSHEHAGPGGVLEMHEQELNRLTKGSTDYNYRDSMKMVAWIKPKMEHKSMVQRLLQLNSHLILCFRAEEKTEIQLLKNRSGKLVNTPVNIGFQSITSKDMAYELTILLGFDPKAPGVPIAIKLADKFKPFVPLDRVLDEESGARLAAWARGERPEAAQSALPPATSPPQTDKEDKSPAVAAALIAEYQAAKSSQEHFALVDNPVKRKQVEWLRKNRKALFQTVNAAVAESWSRNQGPVGDNGGEAPKQGALV